MSLTDPFYRKRNWRLVLKKTGSRCYYCGARHTRRKPLTYDHLVSARRGGTNDLDNLVPACRACNSGKCARTLEEFRPSLAARLLGFPSDTTRKHIEWARRRGADLSDYDAFKFWFERVIHRTHGTFLGTGHADK